MPHLCSLEFTFLMFVQYPGFTTVHQYREANVVSVFIASQSDGENCTDENMNGLYNPALEQVKNIKYLTYCVTLWTWGEFSQKTEQLSTHLRGYRLTYGLKSITKMDTDFKCYTTPVVVPALFGCNARTIRKNDRSKIEELKMEYFRAVKWFTRAYCIRNDDGTTCCGSTYTQYFKQTEIHLQRIHDESEKLSTRVQLVKTKVRIHIEVREQLVGYRVTASGIMKLCSIGKIRPHCNSWGINYEAYSLVLWVSSEKVKNIFSCLTLNNLISG